ncbi:MAG: sigma-70 family RNA polymerase sigma factor, partial [Planctomycetota bacterium]
AESLPSASDELEARAARTELARALRGLDEPSRQVLQLRYFDGLDTATIAQRLGVSELAVRKRLWRARERLRAALEPRTRRSRLTALAPLAFLRRAWRLEVAGIAAASVAVLLAVDLGQREPVLAPTERVALAPSAEDNDGSARATDSSSAAPSDTLRPTGSRQGRTPRAPEPPNDSAPPVRVPETTASLHGLVLDLDGQAQAGLDIVAATEPTRVLGTSDRLGGFALKAGSPAAEFVVRADEWGTVVPARLGPGASEALLLVAPAAPLLASVRGEDGQTIRGARLELVARASAFARITRRVELASEVLTTLVSADGRSFTAAALPRARGLFLRASAPGFQTVERASESCGLECELVLSPEGVGPELAGTVSLADGRPAVGARVRLAQAETRTDGRGTFRLPLRGVERNSVLEVEGDGHATHQERGFGRRLTDGSVRDAYDIVLDRPLDQVEVRLRGLPSDHAGWRVLAYSERAGDEDCAPVEGVRVSDERFELCLARGRHTLYALAPACAASFRFELADSTTSALEIAVAAPLAVHERVGLRADDGSLLAHAEVELSLRLAPGRSARWNTLASNADGVLSYAHAPEAEVELSVRHVALGAAPRACSPEDPLLARANLLRVAGASAHYASLRFSDDSGRWLQTQGPLGMEDGVELLDGASAVLAVPPEARWAEFVGPGGALLRLSLTPLPGELLTLTP